MKIQFKIFLIMVFALTIIYAFVMEDIFENEVVVQPIKINNALLLFSIFIGICAGGLHIYMCEEDKNYAEEFNMFPKSFYFFAFFGIATPCAYALTGMVFCFTRNPIQDESFNKTFIYQSQFQEYSYEYVVFKTSFEKTVEALKRENAKIKKCDNNKLKEKAIFDQEREIARQEAESYKNALKKAIQE